MRNRVCSLAILAGVAFAQAPRHNVDGSRFGERVIAVVPVVNGAPLFAPNLHNPAERPDPRSETALLGMRCEPSDDAKFAICEFIARDKRGLAPILKSGRPDVQAFERNSRATTKAAVEAVMKRYKRDFDFDAFLRPPNVPAAPPAVGGAR